jgi:hypothetical protein
MGSATLDAMEEPGAVIVAARGLGRRFGTGDAAGVGHASCEANAST